MTTNIQGTDLRVAPIAERLPELTGFGALDRDAGRWRRETLEATFSADGNRANRLEWARLGLPVHRRRSGRGAVCVFRDRLYRIEPQLRSVAPSGGLAVGARLLVETKDEHNWKLSGRELSSLLRADAEKMSEGAVIPRGKGIEFTMLRQGHFDRAIRIFANHDFERPGSAPCSANTDSAEAVRRRGAASRDGRTAPTEGATNRRTWRVPTRQDYARRATHRLAAPLGMTKGRRVTPAPHFHEHNRVGDTGLEPVTSRM
jgi:hypothetical protein